MLTNFSTVSKRIARLKEPRGPWTDRRRRRLGSHQEGTAACSSGEGQAREDPRRHPRHGQGALGRLDRRHQEGAPGRRRGAQAGIPVIAILDTNCDPDEVDYKIPGNDDAIRSVTLLTRVIADAVADGNLVTAARLAPTPGDAGDRQEPLAEWERDSWAPPCQATPRRRLTTVAARSRGRAGRSVARSRSPGGRRAEPSRPRPTHRVRRSPSHRTEEDETTLMANYTAADIKALREKPPRRLMDVKKALDEADGDLAKADRDPARQGASRASPSARAARPPTAWSPRGRPTASAPSSRSSARPTSSPRTRRFGWLATAGPRQVATKARDARTLLSSTSDGQTVRTPRRANATIGEKIEIKRVARSRPHVVAYLHKTEPDLPAQIGVLFGSEGGDERGRSRCRDAHRRLRPTAMTRDDRSPTVENERKVAEETAKEEASRRPPCPRSSRVGSAAASRRPCCSSRPSPRTPRSPSEGPHERPGPPRGELRPLPRRRLTAPPRHLMPPAHPSGRHAHVASRTRGRAAYIRAATVAIAGHRSGPSPSPRRGTGAHRADSSSGAMRLALLRPVARKTTSGADDAVEGRSSARSRATAVPDTRSLLRVRAGPDQRLFAIGATSGTSSQGPVQAGPPPRRRR